MTFNTNNFEPKSFVDKIGFSTRGLFALPLKSDFTSIGSVIYQYMNIEKREIKRVPLQMTQKNKDLMVQNINEIISIRKTNDKGYDILFNNCAGKIIELLNKSGLPRELFGIAIPNNLPDHLFRTYNAHYPVLTIPYQSSTSRSSLEKKFDSLPDSYYKLCVDIECAEQVVRTFNKYFPKGKIEFPTYEKTDPTFERPTLRTRTDPTNWNGNKSNVESHYKLLKDVKTGSPSTKADAAQ